MGQIALLILFVWGISIISIFLFSLTRKQLVTFTSDFGFKIHLSPLSSFLTKKDFDKWNWELIWLWSDKRDLDCISIFNSLKGLDITIIDQNSLLVCMDYETGETLDVYGITQYKPRIIYICSLSLGISRHRIRKQIEAVYKHEISHIIGAFVEGLWTHEDSHPVFHSIGIKYAKERDSSE